jgi:hypothetical protein
MSHQADRECTLNAPQCQVSGDLRDIKSCFTSLHLLLQKYTSVHCSGNEDTETKTVTEILWTDEKSTSRTNISAPHEYK